ncbi:LysR family transcriptional regulator [Glacieibacterium frigidum]|uniref:LysR family transcriptional regulator n=1 Tax=Glacieibacterium frigidum TaxID=2593303 RepID=A0A552UH43_9SPHN|nr:LysR family transcriptional regulator [Glacieibacterium frigidum]TRW17530.1 LysR family transcriptional regulator [Glacieibacterium frigidum]
MEMHQIRYFLAVARTLNFTRAAEESNVTQPSLTRAIQKLEDEFGGLLFRRERSLTHLTDMGRQMLPHLERTYQAAQAAKDLARGIGREAVAPLNLGLATPLTTPQLAAALAEVGAGLPGFQLRVVSGQGDALLDDMLKGDLDMVIAAEPRDRHDRLDAIPMFALDYGVVTHEGHALLEKGEATLACLHGVCWIAVGGDLDAEFREVCAAEGVEPDHRHAAGSEADALRLVAARLGSALAVRAAPLPEGVHMVDVAGVHLTRRVVIATVSGRQRPPAGDALIRAIRSRAWP